MKKQPLKNDTDWGNEVAFSVRLIGKVFGKLFSYILNILLTVMLIGLITGTIVGGAFAIYIKNYVDADLEGFEFLATNQNMTTKIYYMDYTDRANRIGVPVELEDQRIYGEQNRMYAPYSKMPKYLIDAFIAIEDKRFLKHGGVDWLRTARATMNWVIGGSKRYGASTLTQQLIKNVTGEDDITIQRKVQEILRALELEKAKDKSEILELYLNTIFLSRRAYGVQAASYIYFGKDVSELTLIECAALAAIPQFPTRYDPYQYPDNNQERRDVVLELMLEEGLITQQEFNLAYKKELKLNMQTIEVQTTGTNSWYKDQVIEDTISLLVEKKGITREMASRMIYTQGLQIYTVMDPEVQNTLEEVFENDESFNFLSKSGLIDPECAMIVIDPYTGDVLGVVGGRGEKLDNRLFNYATQGKRPPGSAIKPVSVYAPALENNLITYGSVFDDVPVNFGEEKTVNGETTYTRLDGWPRNLPTRYNGLTTIQDAIKRSVNTIAVRVLQKLTPEKSFDFVKNQLNLSVIESREIGNGNSVTDIALAPLALGELSYGISVQELTASYAIFVNNGVYNKPKTVIKILDSDGNIIIDNNETGKVVISEATATIMTKMLQGVASTGGTAQSATLREKVNMAGKTGTTSADNDKWFIGYTPYYVGGVWFGYETPKTLTPEYGTSNPSLAIWDKVMTLLHEKYIASGSVKKFTDASNVITKQYCIDSGMVPGPACNLDPRGGRIATGYFTHATAPTQTCNVHVVVDYDKSTGGIASANCPETTKVALIRVETRNFPSWITVTDAQYTYRKMPEGVKMSTVVNEPFYMNAMPQGTYPGRTGGVEYPFNRYCSLHHSDAPPEVEDEYEDEIVDETDDIDINNPDETTEETAEDPTNIDPPEETEPDYEDEDNESGAPPGYVY